MNSSGNGVGYFWCLKHHRVETDADACAAKHTLGPYATTIEAERALERMRERNEKWEADDARWDGEGR